MKWSALSLATFFSLSFSQLAFGKLGVFPSDTGAVPPGGPGGAPTSTNTTTTGTPTDTVSTTTTSTTTLSTSSTSTSTTKTSTPPPPPPPPPPTTTFSQTSQSSSTSTETNSTTTRSTQTVILTTSQTLTPSQSESVLETTTPTPQGSSGQASKRIPIVIGTSVGIIVLILLGYLWWRLNRKRNQLRSESDLPIFPAEEPTAPDDGLSIMDRALSPETVTTCLEPPQRPILAMIDLPPPPLGRIEAHISLPKYAVPPSPLGPRPLNTLRRSLGSDRYSKNSMHTAKESESIYSSTSEMPMTYPQNEIKRLSSDSDQDSSPAMRERSTLEPVATLPAEAVNRTHAKQPSTQTLTSEQLKVQSQLLRARIADLEKEREVNDDMKDEIERLRLENRYWRGQLEVELSRDRKRKEQREFGMPPPYVGMVS